MNRTSDGSQQIEIFDGVQSVISELQGGYRWLFLKHNPWFYKDTEQENINRENIIFPMAVHRLFNIFVSS